MKRQKNQFISVPTCVCGKQCMNFHSLTVKVTSTSCHIRLLPKFELTAPAYNENCL